MLVEAILPIERGGLEIGVTSNDPQELDIPRTMTKCRKGVTYMLSHRRVVKNGKVVHTMAGEGIYMDFQVTVVLLVTIFYSIIFTCIIWRHHGLKLKLSLFDHLYLLNICSTYGIKTIVHNWLQVGDVIGVKLGSLGFLQFLCNNKCLASVPVQENCPMYGVVDLYGRALQASIYEGQAVNPQVMLSIFCHHYIFNSIR